MDLNLPILSDTKPQPLELFSVSSSASQKIKTLLGEDQLLRVSIKGGGCAGLEYVFNIVDLSDQSDDDIVFENIVVDYLSAPYLSGAFLDYKDELVGSYFSFKNPKSSGECGCGKSFAA